MGLNGNQVADQLANLVRNTNIPMNIKLDKENVLRERKKSLEKNGVLTTLT